MEKQEALQILLQVCSMHKATTQEHQVINQALQTLNAAIQSVKQEELAPEKKIKGKK